MRRTPEAIVATARALIGVRFRPQGRSPETGLDCVGLVAAAIGAPPPAADYALRGGSPERIAAALGREGLVQVAAAEPGDVLVMRPGPAQLHLGIRTAEGLVHGDAALRRIVERPLPVPWPVLHIWRRGTD